MDDLVFSEADYEAMREHEQLKAQWVRKYGTLMHFDRAYALLELARVQAEVKGLKWNSLGKSTTARTAGTKAQPSATRSQSRTASGPTSRVATDATATT